MKTVRVRIAVAVNKNNKWVASAFNGSTTDEFDVGNRIVQAGAVPFLIHWVEADLPSRAAI